MKFNHAFILALLFFSTTAMTFQSCVSEANATSPENTISPKKWTSFEEAVDLSKIDQKKILVDVYTDWCKWCKVMDDKTFSDPEMSDYLSKNFHLAKFNAEQKETITFKGKEFAFTKNGRRGQHEFASELLNGQLAYPSLVVFDNQLNKLEVIRGFKNPQELMKILSPSL